VGADHLPVSPGHPFYTRLNRILDDAGFDRFAAVFTWVASTG
jgi:ribosomal protein L31